jgi:NAD/NADP transhydrogenase alpha subunit
MVARATLKPHRRAVRTVDKARHCVTVPSLLTAAARIAFSRPAKAAYVAVGAVGLVAVAVALIGPKRLEQEMLKPLRGAIAPRAEKIWADSQGLREQLAGMFQSASPTGRERLARNFQSWIGHFRAT